MGSDAVTEWALINSHTHACAAWLHAGVTAYSPVTLGFLIWLLTESGPLVCTALSLLLFAPHAPHAAVHSGVHAPASVDRAGEQCKQRNTHRSAAVRVGALSASCFSRRAAFLGVDVAARVCGVGAVGYWALC